jgi:hypothetical protein
MTSQVTVSPEGEQTENKTQEINRSLTVFTVFAGLGYLF